MLDSINREYVLETELDMELPENSVVVVETTTEAGCEVSALRLIGGKAHPPTGVSFRMSNRTTSIPTTATFVNIETGDGRKVTLPPNRAITSIKIRPLVAETTEVLVLKPLSNSELAMLFKKS